VTNSRLGEATRVLFFDFIERSNRAESADEVFHLLRGVAAEYGFERIAFAATTQPAQDALARQDIEPVVAHNYPADWADHYFTNDYAQFDPILQLAPQSDVMLDWEHVVKHGHLTSKQTRLMIESREAGLYNGLSIPIHGPRGESYAASFATETPVRDGPADLRCLQLVAVQFHIAYSRLSLPEGRGVDPVRLTDRERECLVWTARGKSAWAISMIIGVSEHTVNFHLKSIMRKLNAANRIQAVALAVRLGLVNP